ncbi:MAG: TdeIII family type II restriction endonuclease [Candidatus Peregrinibacteria bacterium]
MPLSSSLQASIRRFLKKKILAKVDAYSLDEEDASKPFQYALFTKKGYLVKGFIHGCETALGNWHEHIAKIIAEANFSIAKKLQGKERLHGVVTIKADSAISEILSGLDSATHQPNYEKEKATIMRVGRIGRTVKRVQTVDLFLVTKTGQEIYVEIKGPKPNKNEMRAAKRDLLEILAMRAAKQKNVHAFLGMYYNPYAPQEYQRWTCLKFFDPGEDFLIGKSFWDFLGGRGAYEDLIHIYETVGEEIRPVLEKKLKSLR